MSDSHAAETHNAGGTNMSRSDELKLIRRAQRGQAEAFRDIVERYKDRLFAFVYRMLRHHHEAEDICQSAFVKAFESLASYNEKYAFSTWLFTIAYRMTLNHLRKRKPLSGETDFSRFGSLVPDAADEVANSEQAQRLRDTIWTAVDQLTPPQRSAVLLFYQEGKSCQEIGKVLGIPAVTVKSHLHRARQKLHTLLGQDVAQQWSEVRRIGEARTA